MRFKWNEYGSYVYYLGFFSYLLFLATFTVFISVSPNPAAFPDFYQDDSSCHFDHNSTSPDGPSDPPELSAVQEYSSYITMVLVIILALFELLQAFRVCTALCFLIFVMGTLNHSTESKPIHAVDKLTRLGSLHPRFHHGSSDFRLRNQHIGTQHGKSEIFNNFSESLKQFFSSSVGSTKLVPRP